MMVFYRQLIIFVLIFFALSACNLNNTTAVTATPISPTQIPTVSVVPPTPTNIYTPTPLPLITISATVWTREPLVPILNLHQFMPDGIVPSSKNGHKMQLGDLRASLQNLYDNGFSLISLENWLAGDLDVPIGRRPLILTMDDVFFRNQIMMGNDGQPEPDTGIGVIWQFSREHPDFGFHLALFSILGDKYYPSNPNDDPDWENKFSRMLVWCIENDALVYNHTYFHGYLGLVENPVSMKTFIEQLQANDIRLRELLTIADREDLIPRLGNIIALPGGAPPQTSADWDSLRSYLNPEGLPVQAVMQVYSAATDPVKLTYLTSPFNPEFNKYQIPRITGTLYYIQYVIDQRDQFPLAQSCILDLVENRLQDTTYLSDQINATIQSGDCPLGLYMLESKLFDARSLPVTFIATP